MGRLELIVPPSSAAIVHRNPVGLILKPHQLNRFWLIVDLAAPQGFNVIYRISSALCSLEYASVDKAAELIACCSRGALMAKTDLLSAYRQVHIHNADSALLGLEWEGRTYIDTALPFCLRSAPKLFSAVAESLAWALECEGIQNSLHYLDDFLFLGLSE